MAPPRDGSKLYPTDAEWAQFESLIQKNVGRTGQCWIMDGPLRGQYPYFMFRGESMMAARFAYRAQRIEARRHAESARCWAGGATRRSASTRITSSR